MLKSKKEFVFKNSPVDRQALQILQDPNVAEEEWLKVFAGPDGTVMAPVQNSLKKSRVISTSTALIMFVGLTISGLYWHCLVPTAKPLAPPEYVRNQIDYRPYMANLQRRVKRAWFPPINNASKFAEVTFKVYRDGAIDSLKLEKQSGDARLDASCLAAVRNAVPFQVLPEGSEPSVDISFTFDYNVRR